MNWTPAETGYHVRLAHPPDRTPGGIYLPENLERAATEGEVLAVGPGMACDGGRSPMQAKVGERVLFEQHRFKPLGDGQEGVVDDEDLAAIETDALVPVMPANEWLLVETEPKATERESGIAIPEKYRKWHRCGKVLDYGPGRLLLKGNFRGTRQPVNSIMSLEEGESPWEMIVHWDKNARLLILNGARPNLLLVKASDIIGVSEEN